MEMTDKSVCLSGLRGRPPSWSRPTGEAIAPPIRAGRSEQPPEYSTDPAPLVIRVPAMGASGYLGRQVSPAFEPTVLDDLGPLYHDSRGLGAGNEQIPNFTVNQRVKEPILL